MSDLGVFVAPLIGWFLAQGIKYVLRLRRDGFQLSDLYASGGFPSSHTASTVALATYIGAVDGWTSHLFAIAAVFAAVVMYDSVGVRRATGENAKILKELVARDIAPKKPIHVRTALGHAPNEVLGGAVVGVIVGLVFSVW